MDNNNNNNNAADLVIAHDDKSNDNNVQDRQFTRTADLAARGITRAQKFIKSHYRGLLMAAGAGAALGVLYAVRRNNDDSEDSVEDSVEYEFDNDSADTTDVDTAPMSNNTL